MQRWGIAHEIAHLLPSSAGPRLHLGPWLAGVALLLTGLASVLVTASSWRGPRQWQQRTGRDADQHHSPKA